MLISLVRQLMISYNWWLHRRVIMLFSQFCVNWSELLSSVWIRFFDWASRTKITLIQTYGMMKLSCLIFITFLKLLFKSLKLLFLFFLFTLADKVFIFSVVVGTCSLLEDVLHIIIFDFSRSVHQSLYFNIVRNVSERVSGIS
jgi:hypothetical protein